MGLLTVNSSRVGGTYIFLVICYLPAAPILMTLAAGYPHRPWQFPRRGWLPVPDGMVFDERFFFCRSTSTACISHGLTALCASLLVSSHEHLSWSAGTVCTSHGRHSRGPTALCAHLLAGNFFRLIDPQQYRVV